MPPFLRRTRIRNRSTTRPVMTPTAMTKRKASHQFKPESKTHLARSNADSVPICAWARFRNRFDL